MAAAAACMSSWSRTGSSPICVALATTRVGARSSFGADSGPAAPFSFSSARGPTTRKRHGFVRLWLGAQRASSNSSSSVARSTGSLVYALWVRRVRIACSTSMGDLTLAIVGQRPLDLLGPWRAPELLPQSLLHLRLPERLPGRPPHQRVHDE